MSETHFLEAAIAGELDAIAALWTEVEPHAVAVAPQTDGKALRRYAAVAGFWEALEGVRSASAEDQTPANFTLLLEAGVVGACRRFAERLADVKAAQELKDVSRGQISDEEIFVAQLMRIGVGPFGTARVLGIRRREAISARRRLRKRLSDWIRDAEHLVGAGSCRHHVDTLAGPRVNPDEGEWDRAVACDHCRSEARWVLIWKFHLPPQRSRPKKSFWRAFGA